MCNDTLRGGGCPSPLPPDPRRSDPPISSDQVLDAAIRDYVARGFSIIPLIPGAKHPCIGWKCFQERRASLDEVLGWRDEWPGLGLAVVLGPISGLFAIDSDGPEADQALRAHLGELPAAPMVLSGSGKPCRFHMYFQDPGCPTGARFTPWHDSLEFRGNRGITVLPPSMHKSGNRYAWAPGRSLADLPLPEVPAPVLAALEGRARSRSRSHPVAPARSGAAAPRLEGGASGDARPGIVRATRDFLRGKYAEADAWNDRLFRAACDLNGNGVPLEVALPRLLAGARPWTDEDREAAERTIRSAYSTAREPARRRASRRPGGAFTIPIRQDDTQL